MIAMNVSMRQAEFVKGHEFIIIFKGEDFRKVWPKRERERIKRMLVVMQEMQDERDMGSMPGQGGSPGERNACPLQYLAWEISWTEELGGLQSMRLQRVGHN